jgi:hypothetical protein
MKHTVATALWILALAFTPALAADPMQSHGNGQVQTGPDDDDVDARTDDRSYRHVPYRSYRPARMRSYKECRHCDVRPRKRYDSVEVIKSRRHVDHSRIIRTQSVAPLYRHAHPVVSVPAVTVVEYVVRHYHVVEVPQAYSYPAPAYRRAWPTHRRMPMCRHGHRGHHPGHCNHVLRVGG